MNPSYALEGAWTIFKKDFASYCRSWTGVLVSFSFLLISGIFFTVFVLGYSQLSFEAVRQPYEGIDDLNLTRFVVGSFLLNLGVFFLFVAPLLSMRSFSEERRMGTLELLYTYPLSDIEIVLGKYLALAAELTLLYLPTLTYLVVLKFLGTDLEGGIFVAGSLGFIFLGAMCLAIGLFFSSLTENQMLAASLTFMVLLALWILEWLTGFLPPGWGNPIRLFSPFVHYRDFSLGILDLSDLTYFLSAIAFFLFLTLRVVETRNWKG